jgi:type II secretory pathway component PulL
MRSATTSTAACAERTSRGKLMRYRGHLVRRAMSLAALLLLVQGVATFVNARREQAQAQQAQAAAMKAAADAQAVALRKP